MSPVQALTLVCCRLRTCRTRKSTKYPTRVNSLPMQIYATATAILRESSYPQIHISNKWFSWLSPPPLGRSLVLLCYWAVVVYMMTYKAVVNDPNYYERLGFRNAWIAVTQVPLVYLLATKSSIIGHIIGSSHEVSVGEPRISFLNVTKYSRNLHIFPDVTISNRRVETELAPPLGISNSASYSHDSWWLLHGGMGTSRFRSP